MDREGKIGKFNLKTPCHNLKDLFFADCVNVGVTAVVCGALTGKDILSRVRSAEPVATTDEEEQEHEAPVWTSAKKLKTRLFKFEQGEEEAATYPSYELKLL